MTEGTTTRPGLPGRRLMMVWPIGKMPNSEPPSRGRLERTLLWCERSWATRASGPCKID